MKFSTLGLFIIATLYAAPAIAQHEWIAPEGKIINYRTLTWKDFLGKPDKYEPEYTGAAVRPAIYMTADSVEQLSDDRFSIKFHVKCAFQSGAWAREVVKEDRSYFYLNHEQEHYDIALTYANILQARLSGRDYGEKDYKKVIDSIYKDVLTKYYQTQDDYDGQSNHSLIKDKQHLWDMRIKKCLENNTDEFYTSSEDVVKSVFYLVQNMKRIPNEPARQFVTRARPIYSEFTEELSARMLETKEWTPDNKAIVAFYSQQYVKTAEDEPEKAGVRLIGDIFLTRDKISYKRTLIDSFNIDDKETTLVDVFFANADSDSYKELIVITAAEIKDKSTNGKQYSVKVYDNVLPNVFPARLKRLDDISARLDSGIEGYVNGKPVKAKYKTKAEVEAELKKMGYN